MDTKINPEQPSNLQRTLDSYHRMVEEVEDYAIILLDIEGNIQNWNKGAEKIKGYKSEDIVGKSFKNFYFPEDIDSRLPERLLEQARVTGKATHEGWRRRKDNSRFWGSIVITAIHDDENNVIGFTKVTRDLTERKLSEDQIKQYTAELEFKNKELNQFVSIASHDLQEPLRKIGIFASLLSENLDDKESSVRYLEKISSSAQRMSNLIKEVLRYSMLSTEEMAVSTNLNQILKNIADDFEVTIREKNATIKYPEMPFVKGIPIQLHQLFANIIGNALKFNDKLPLINIEWERITELEKLQYPLLNPKFNYIRFSITDNGLGFSQEYSEKIFKMFQRLDASQQGTGIGLALCKKIIENHHGHITALSEEGKGTTITFYLPE
jgi:PAS domain S-box-containing protein